MPWLQQPLFFHGSGCSGDGPVDLADNPEFHGDNRKMFGAMAIKNFQSNRKKFEEMPTMQSSEFFTFCSMHVMSNFPGVPCVIHHLPTQLPCA